MTFLTFRTADIFDSHRIHLTRAHLIAKVSVDTVKFVSLPVIGTIREGNFGRAVAVDAPAHAEIGELFDLIHFLDRAMAGLALDFPYPYMLGVVEVDQVGQVMDLDPFDGMAWPGVFSFLRVITRKAV
jgi:hypothetical protein